MKINRLISSVLDQPIGFLSSGAPVYPVLGGAADLEVEPDTDEEEPDEEEQSEEVEDSKGKKSKYTPPEEAEWLRTRTALAKANGSAKERRLALAEAQKRIDALEKEKADREAAEERRELLAQQKAQADASAPTGRRGKKGAQPTGGGGVAPGLPDGVLTKAQVKAATAAAAKEAETAAAERFRTQIVNTVARAALISEGVSKESAGRIVRMLDVDEIEVDENGEVTGGLDEQLEQLKSDLPQLFKPAEPEPPKPRRRPAPRITASEQPPAPERRLSSAEQMAQSVLGSRV